MKSNKIVKNEFFFKNCILQQNKSYILERAVEFMEQLQETNRALVKVKDHNHSITTNSSLRQQSRELFAARLSLIYCIYICIICSCHSQSAEEQT